MIRSTIIQTTVKLTHNHLLLTSLHVDHAIQTDVMLLYARARAVEKGGGTRTGCALRGRYH